MKTSNAVHYLDHASMGRPGRETLRRMREELAEVARVSSSGTDETLRELVAVENARKRVAKFIHADPQNVLLVGNTTQALGMVATSLPLRRGDNILMADSEFMGAPIVWRGVCRRVGVELLPVRSVAGRVLAEQYAERANSRTRAIFVSAVQEVSGYRADLRAIREVASRSDAYLIVDGIQEVGARPVDFEKLNVDAYCAGGHKWLRSPFGLGFACLAPRLREILDPPFQGYFALAEPEQGWDNYMGLSTKTPFDPLPERRDAGRMETGGFLNWLGAVALDAAIGELDALGAVRVWKRISELRNRLVKGLAGMGLEVLGGADAPDEAHAGITTFCMPGGPDEEKQLVQRLAHARIFLVMRYVSGVGGIRVAVHESNKSGDVDALLAVTKRFLAKRKK